MPGWEPLLSPLEQGGLAREKGSVQGLAASPGARAVGSESGSSSSALLLLLSAPRDTNAPLAA